MLVNSIIYTDNVLVSIVRNEEPFGVEGYFNPDLAAGLRRFVIRLGYMEIKPIRDILKEAGVNPKATFYEVEEIVTRNPIWKIFAAIKRLTPPPLFTSTGCPPNRLHGVMTRVEML